MSQRFIKGLTNQHLTWVGVDATDFATPESALSAATKIKIYGKLRGATGVNFVSSGTGSLTNAIQHVGASALGIYTIALAKADLSDASAAWYDQYIISLSATGAAYQTLVVDGGIVESQLLALSDAVSNVQSYLVVMSGIQSDIYSAISDLQSDFGSRVPKLVATNSQLSDLHSDLRSYLVVMSGVLSDTYSGIVALSDASSDILSRLNSASFLSDIASHVWAAKYTANSAASSFGSLLSDIYSRAGGAVTASDISDIASAVWATPLATKLVQLNPSDLSDLRSAIATAPAATITASDISDIASAVWAAKYTAHSAASTFGSLFSDVYSRVVLIQSAASDAASGASDLRSYLVAMSGVLSDTYSAVILIPTAVSVSDMSDIASRVWSAKYTAHSAASSFGSLLSDVYSRVVLIQSAASDAASAATQTNSRVLLVQSRLSDLDSRLASDTSDIYSLLSDFASDFGSRVPKAVATNSQLSDLASDLRSYLAGMSGTLSDVYSLTSNINSLAVNNDAAHILRRNTVASVVADTSTVEFDAGANATNDFYNGAQVLFVAGTGAGQGPRLITDYTGLTKKAVVKPAFVTTPDATTSFLIRTNTPWLSQVHSDLRSQLVALSGVLSDTYSAVSDLQSDFQSRVPKRVATDSQLSDIHSDLRSYLVGLSATLSDTYSALSDFQSDFQSRVPKEVASKSLLSDVSSDLRSLAVANHSMASDLYSLASDFQSDFQSRVPKAVATNSQLSDLASDLRSYLAGMSGTLSDVYSLVSDVHSNVTGAGVQKNTALAAFEFYMVDSTDHVTAKTGLTVTAQRSIDGGAFAACANAPTEVGSGIYTIDLAATDLNGTVITLKFTAAAADATIISIKTNP